MTAENITAYLVFLILAILCHDLKSLTKKWADDRLFDRAVGFFVGAALVVLFV